MNGTSQGRTSALGGQVPLLKHAVMVWLQTAKERGHGRIHGDMYNIAADTKASPTNVTRALFDLQKQGLITFRERKNAGINGHGSTTVLARFDLTPKGKEWNAERAVYEDLPQASTVGPEDVNPQAVAMVQVDDVANEMNTERIQKMLAWTPDQSAIGQLVALLIRSDHPLRIRDVNIALGYAPGSTALYSLAKTHAGGLLIHKGTVSFVGGPDWEPVPPKLPGLNQRRHGRERKPLRSPVAISPMLLREAEASVALDHDPHEGTQSVEPTYEEMHPAFPEGLKPIEAIAKAAAAFQTEADAAGYGRKDPPAVGPLIWDLLHRSVRRSKVQEAVTLLEAAGLEEDALNALTRIPDDTPLEVEVLALINQLDGVMLSQKEE